MKILQINIFGNGSTGRIAVDIHKTLIKNGHEGKVAFARGLIEDGIPHIKIGTNLDIKIHGFMTRLTDKTGFYSNKSTEKLIEDIKSYNPDVVHLHNIHGYYINIERLLNFLKEYGKPVVWTLHDCWAFTGHCAYFDFIKCDKWKTGCNHCPQKHTYPASKLLDNSKWNWKKKKELFTGLNMTIVTPSNWLANLVKQSFLKEYKVFTINNGIDLSVFKPTPSDFRKKNNLENKFIVLGVASEWTERKGLADFIKLSQIIDENYKIVLVGLNKKQLKEIPSTILGIKRTNSVKELTEIYSIADIFFNPTYEDNFPTTNLESLACGTQVITYNTGGSPESLNQDCGKIIKPEKLNDFIKVIKSLEINSGNCKVQAKKFDKDHCFKKYIDIYYGFNKRCMFNEN